MRKQKQAAASITQDHAQADERLSPQFFIELLTEVGTLLATSYDRRSGLSRNQTRIIVALLHRDGQTQTELAHELQIHKVSVGIYVGELEALGLVERRSHPRDKRAKCIFLTPLLLSQKHVGDAYVAEIHNAAVQGIGESDYLVMLACIARMRTNLAALDERDRAARRQEKSAG